MDIFKFSGYLKEWIDKGKTNELMIEWTCVWKFIGGYE